MSLLIQGGRIITAVDDYVADIFVEDETIGLIGEALEVEADEVIDAAGLYVLPGGVDPHTHMAMPFGGTVTCDDFTSGTISAAFGGTTTIVDFALQTPGEPPLAAVEAWHRKLDAAKPVIDVGFHLAVTDLSSPDYLSQLRRMPDEGITSYKLFMAYKNAIMVDDETLFRTMVIAAETDALVLVHAENGDVIDVLVKDALEAGHTDPSWHARTRPIETESEATARAIKLAHIADAHLYVVHVSCGAAAAEVALAKAGGFKVAAETCTQYLFVDESYLARPDFEGAKYVFTPPPRPRVEQDRLWSALRQGTLSVISSDHAPFRWADQKSLGRDDFSRIPNGAPGVEDRLQMVYHLGVRTGKISMNEFVQLVSTNPARIFGLYPRKGAISIGSDADLVLWDPSVEAVVSASGRHSNIDYNLFEDVEVFGGPVLVTVRGKVIVDRGAVLRGQPGDGMFVRRSSVTDPRTVEVIAPVQ